MTSDVTKAIASEAHKLSAGLAVQNLKALFGLCYLSTKAHILTLTF